MEFSRPEYWSGKPFPSSGDLPNPGREPRSFALQADSLPAEPHGKPKNIGVGSLSFLQWIFWTEPVFCIAGGFLTNWAIRESQIMYKYLKYIHVWRSEVNSLSHVRLFATPWPVAYQAPPSMGFSRQEFSNELPFPSPGDLLDSEIEPRSFALQADSLLSEPPGEPSKLLVHLQLIDF